MFALFPAVFSILLIAFIMVGISASLGQAPDESGELVTVAIWMAGGFFSVIVGMVLIPITLSFILKSRQVRKQKPLAMYWKRTLVSALEEGLSVSRDESLIRRVEGSSSEESSGGAEEKVIRELIRNLSDVQSFDAEDSQSLAGFRAQVLRNSDWFGEHVSPSVFFSFRHALERMPETYEKAVEERERVVKGLPDMPLFIK